MLKERTASKWLVGLLLLFFIVAPFAGETRVGGAPLTHILLSVTMLGMVAGLGTSRRLVLAGVVLAVTAVVCEWTGRASENDGLKTAGFALDAALLLLVSLVTVKHLWRQRRVTGEMLRQAVAAYLVIGLFFAEMYRLVEHTMPGAISRSGTRTFELVYFSFVTMTTLGYGEIVPKNDVARSLAMMQALIGQAFMAFVVAKLVSLYWAQAQEEDADSE